MKKLIHYILIGIMLNWNVAVLADDDVDGCKWETVEETEQYLQEQCISADGNQYSARIRSKPIDDSITYVKMYIFENEFDDDDIYGYERLDPNFSELGN